MVTTQECDLLGKKFFPGFFFWCCFSFYYGSFLILFRVLFYFLFFLDFFMFIFFSFSFLFFLFQKILHWISFWSNICKQRLLCLFFFMSIWLHILFMFQYSTHQGVHIFAILWLHPPLYAYIWNIAVSIFSCNVKGLGSIRKRWLALKEFKSSKADVIMIQETHFKTNGTFKFASKQFPTAFIASDPTGKAGVAILLKRFSSIQVKTSYADPQILTPELWSQ